ncbi:MAG: hypothetical protein AAGA75_25500 [Cyanobacteria bacterium P01_E01_bin.6]
MKRTIKSLLIPGLLATSVMTASLGSVQSSASADTLSEVDGLPSADVVLDGKENAGLEDATQRKHHRGHRHHRRRRFFRHFYH